MGKQTMLPAMVTLLVKFRQTHLQIRIFFTFVSPLFAGGHQPNIIYAIFGL